MSLFGQPQEPPELALHRQSLNLNKQQMTMEAGMVDDQTYLQQSEEREDTNKMWPSMYVEQAAIKKSEKP